MHDVAPAYGDLIGSPFKWRGRGPGGYDCFGLVLEMFRRAGHDMPDWDTPPDIQAVSGLVAAEFSQGRWVPCERRAGAMVLFNMVLKVGGRRVLAPTHCGFMLSTFEFIHAWEETGGITVERMPDWERRIAGFYTFKGSE